MKMTKVWLSSLLLLITSNCANSTEQQEVEAALQLYIDGTSFSQPDKISDAFYTDANLFLSHKEKPVWIVPVQEYTSWFNKVGRITGRIGNILAIDIQNDIATAKIEILHPQSQSRYIDLLLLKKLNNHWKIISKTATSTAGNNSGQRILFIVSNAHFHGDSQIPAGVSFGEIVNAYDLFTQAGYTVDFVSPEGGAIPLSYVNTSEKLHKQYLYDTDFMYAIGHTHTPADIDPSQYAAVQYIGGSNAMYGVANNEAIQRIAMAVYEQHNGIISSVCHGTAGIVHLRTSDGNYLVKDKRITGYPDSFENPDKAYFKEFPFLIQKTTEAHGGNFYHSPRNNAHVEVDGRIVTGQNFLSSAPVALKIIELIESQG